jgi:hypothetical protein
MDSHRHDEFLFNEMTSSYCNVYENPVFSCCTLFRRGLHWGRQRRGGIYMTKILRGVMTLLGATAFLAVSAATAFAGDPYATGGGGVAGESTGGGGGTLPFTGAELALYVVIGLAIVASGLALRAYSARRVS